MAEEEKKPFLPFDLPPANSRLETQAKEKPETSPKSTGLIMGLLPGMILILLGGLFLLSFYGDLEGDWWQYFGVGLGIVCLVQASWQHNSSRPRGAELGRLIMGILMIVCGLLSLFVSNQWWPLALIVSGLVLNARFMWKRRKTV